MQYISDKKDLDYRNKDFINCINGELINNWGNFINRTLSFVKSKFDGKIHKTYVNDEIQTRIINTFNNTSNYIEKGKISNRVGVDVLIYINRAFGIMPSEMFDKSIFSIDKYSTAVNICNIIVRISV